MSTIQYYRLALLQYIKLNHHIADIQQQLGEIEEIKDKIASRHKKHRRTDREIEKNFHCGHCQRIYATEVALRLHLKLKHPETLCDKSSQSGTLNMFQSQKQNVDINESVV